LEVLESRCQPSTLTPAADVPDTLSLALDLTPALTAGHVRVASSIGDNALGGADVDWYRLDFSEPTSIALTLAGAGVISLYNDDPFSPDPTVQVLHRRLLDQASSDGASLGLLSRSLAPGTYFVAVSGAGNQWFHPELADSGVSGQTGAYQLDVSTGALSVEQPTLLATDIPADGVFTQSPRALHLTFSGDPAFADAFVVQTLDGSPADFPPLEFAYFSPEASEIQIVFAQALAQGDYQIWAFGGDNFDFLFEPIGFAVAAVEGGAAANDSVGTAHDLGALDNAGLVQVPGVIGDNPFYVYTGGEPGPGADLDFYRFTIQSPGQYNLVAEAFAHRIGSSLNVGLTLFQLVDGQPVLVAGNHDSINEIIAGDASRPLYEDAVLFLKLEAGEYFVVVSADENTLDPYQGEAPGPDWYDPLVNNSAWRGQTTGNYVLNILLEPADLMPLQVTYVSIAGGAEFNQPLTTFAVQFNEPVNLPQLTNSIFQPERRTTYAVYIENEAGDRWYPRLADYDPGTAQADFLMLDRLPAGSYELHLSGAHGLADLFGNPLAETVVSFSILSDTTSSFPITLTDPDDSFEQPTDLGVLFPRELEQGVAVVRDFTGQTPGDGADWHRFTVTELGEYIFRLAGDSLTVSGRPVLLDSAGAPIPGSPDDANLRVELQPGTYIIMVTWDPDAVPNAVYELRIELGFSPENPTPLTHGPAPAFRLHLLTSTPPATPSTPIVRLPQSNVTVVPATLLTATPPALPSGGTLTLAAGPLGGSSGTASGDSTSAALRLNLSALSFATAKDGLLLSDPGVSPESEGDADLLMQQFWRRIVDLLFQTITPLGLGSDAGELLLKTEAADAGVDFNAGGDLKPGSDAKPVAKPGVKPVAAAEHRTSVRAPQTGEILVEQADWTGACLALSGLLVVRDRSRRKLAPQARAARPQAAGKQPRLI
jgi:hypothetical protein